MSHHGDYDAQQQKWYCGYWMIQDEWLEIHDYSPPTLQQEPEQTEENDEE
jgi:hypothetical protein